MSSFDYDKTGKSPDNKVVAEYHDVRESIMVIPEEETLVKYSLTVIGVLEHGDPIESGEEILPYRGYAYSPGHKSLTDATGNEVFSYILLQAKQYEGVYITYNAVGGNNKDLILWDEISRMVQGNLIDFMDVKSLLKLKGQNVYEAPAFDEPGAQASSMLARLVDSLGTINTTLSSKGVPPVPVEVDELVALVNEHTVNINNLINSLNLSVNNLNSTVTAQLNSNLTAVNTAINNINAITGEEALTIITDYVNEAIDLLSFNGVDSHLYTNKTVRFAEDEDFEISIRTSVISEEGSTAHIALIGSEHLTTPDSEPGASVLRIVQGDGNVNLRGLQLVVGDGAGGVAKAFKFGGQANICNQGKVDLKVIRKDGSIRGYVNGEQMGATFSSSDVIYFRDFSIGGPEHPLEGEVDNLSIYKDGDSTDGTLYVDSKVGNYIPDYDGESRLPNSVGPTPIYNGGVTLSGGEITLPEIDLGDDWSISVEVDAKADVDKKVISIIAGTTIINIGTNATGANAFPRVFIRRDGQSDISESTSPDIFTQLFDDDFEDNFSIVSVEVEAGELTVRCGSASFLVGMTPIPFTEDMSNAVITLGNQTGRDDHLHGHLSQFSLVVGSSYIYAPSSLGAYKKFITAQDIIYPDVWTDGFVTAPEDFGDGTYRIYSSSSGTESVVTYTNASIVGTKPILELEVISGTIDDINVIDATATEWESVYDSEGVTIPNRYRCLLTDIPASSFSLGSAECNTVFGNFTLSKSSNRNAAITGVYGVDYRRASRNLEFTAKNLTKITKPRIEVAK